MLRVVREGVCSYQQYDICRFTKLAALIRDLTLISERPLHRQAYIQITRQYYGEVWIRQTYKSILNP